jgi:hypothetical protein
MWNKFMIWYGELLIKGFDWVMSREDYQDCHTEAEKQEHLELYCKLKTRLAFRKGGLK